MIRSPNEMHTEELRAAMLANALCRLGGGSYKWLRQVANTSGHVDRLTVAARAELGRRDRLEAE